MTSNWLDIYGHQTLRQLIHLADEDGPYEGFSGAVRDISGSGFPTSIIWYTSSARTAKIVEKTITYNVDYNPSTLEWKVYSTDGTTVIATVTDTVTYSGLFETTRTRVIT